jgi:hypothetical protein
MANTLITPDWITKKAAPILVNSLKFAGNVNRNYDDQYRQAGAKVGYTVKARLPQRFRTTKGQAFQQQNITDSYVPVTITDQANVAISFSSASMTMEVDDYTQRYIKPASEQLANTIDYDGLARTYVDVYQFVGTPGTSPSANLTYLQAGAILTDAAAPVSGRTAVLSPESMMTLANANQTLFNPARFQSETFRSGQFAGEALGVESWYQDQNVARHTTGTFTASTPLVDTASQTGSSLITDGWASGATTLNQGDTFTIAGVYAVNPQNYQSTGRLQQFVVTATISDTAGAITIPISPSIITSGQQQTVTASPANNAVITVTGATSATAGTLAATLTSQSLIFTRDAFTMVMADLEMPEGGALASRVSNNQLGVALRFAKQWNIQTDQNAARLDCLYGWKTIRPEMAARVYGGA